MEKKFKRYVVLELDKFDKIQNGYFSSSHLSSIENELLKILKDTKMSVDQRLALYHQLLYENQVNESPKATQTNVDVHERKPMLVSKRKTFDKDTQTRIKLKKNADTQTK